MITEHRFPTEFTLAQLERLRALAGDEECRARARGTYSRADYNLLRKLDEYCRSFNNIIPFRRTG